MRSIQWAGVALLGSVMVLAAGCRKPEPPAGPAVAPPADTQTVQQIRQEFQQFDANAVVGLVIAVLPDTNLAAVGDIPADSFKVGELLTFIDSNRATIAVGNVVATTPDAVHVKYQPQGDIPRAPQEGDLAVRIKS